MSIVSWHPLDSDLYYIFIISFIRWRFILGAIIIWFSEWISKLYGEWCWFFISYSKRVPIFPIVSPRCQAHIAIAILCMSASCVCVFQVLLRRKWKYSAGTVLCAVAINVSSTYSIRKLWILSSCSIRSFVRFRFPFFAMRYYQHHSQRICARFVRCMQHTLMRSSALTQPSRTMHSKT